MKITARVVAATFLGAWLAGTIVVGWAATVNFMTIDRLLTSGTSSRSQEIFRETVGRLEPDEGRALLRFVASEVNRDLFLFWGWAAAALGCILLACAYFPLKEKKLIYGFGAMLLCSVVMSLYLTPEMMSLGRSLDFISREPPPPGLAHFGRLHAAYLILNLLQVMIGIWMGIVLARPPQPGSPRD